MEHDDTQILFLDIDSDNEKEYQRWCLAHGRALIESGHIQEGVEMMEEALDALAKLERAEWLCELGDM